MKLRMGGKHVAKFREFSISRRHDRQNFRGNFRRFCQVATLILKIYQLYGRSLKNKHIYNSAPEGFPSMNMLSLYAESCNFIQIFYVVSVSRSFLSTKRVYIWVYTLLVIMYFEIFQKVSILIY